MTERDATHESDTVLDAVARASAQLIPALAERLRRHGLAEVEVEDGDLVVRVAAAPAPVAPARAASSGRADGVAQPAAGGAGGRATERVGVPVASPAVGFFVYADGLGPGLSVEKGDALGHVEMLGVRHDVRAPRRGTVRHLVAETGEAVEYGQVVVEIDPAEAAR
jgi:acetyl-CoA carboxylase biotin carboxyl carrier protein